DYQPVWQRNEHGGGIITGSVGAFLVLESRTHAEARGASPYARIHDVLSDRCPRKPGEAAGNARKQFDALRDRLNPGPLPILSGACGAEPVTSEEVWFMNQLRDDGYDLAIRAVGSLLGHSAEASFPAGLALAAIAASKGRLFGPVASSDIEKPYNDSMDSILVTSWGHWRGEGLALVEAVH
ncbi:MAG: hypothetical protein MI861_00325, partial [Pirellulales bacterium]|nr:hypothetical protein [Pirellulales bacterium]